MDQVIYIDLVDFTPFACGITSAPRSSVWVQTTLPMPIILFLVITSLEPCKVMFVRLCFDFPRITPRPVPLR